RKILKTNLIRIVPPIINSTVSDFFYSGCINTPHKYKRKTSQSQVNYSDNCSSKKALASFIST
ncbi:MAG: hypothetical protein SCK70_13090, partial [bacterium]|nr:hypothetical protein [bacterium]